MTRHYIRINPAVSSEGAVGDEDPDKGELRLANQKPGDRSSYPANEIVDAGFLELVRFGIRQPGDPLIEDSLKVIDAVLKVDTPVRPLLEALQPRRLRPARRWHLVQGLGSRPRLAAADAGARDLRTGARAAISMSTCARPKAFATGVGLFPEQIWDAPDIPEEHMFFGKATGAAIPLVVGARRICQIAALGGGQKDFRLHRAGRRALLQRYIPRRVIEVWKINRQVPQSARWSSVAHRGVIAVCAALER